MGGRGIVFWGGWADFCKAVCGSDLSFSIPLTSSTDVCEDERKRASNPAGARILDFSEGWDASVATRGPLEDEKV